MFWSCPGRHEVQLQPVGMSMRLVPDAELPSFTDLFEPKALHQALAYQRDWLQKQNAARTWTFGEFVADRAHMIASLDRFESLWKTHAGKPQALRQAITQEFDCYQVHFDGSSEMLITSYHAPIYRGALVQSAEFPHPIYARPQDLIRIRPSLFPEKFLRPGESLRNDRVVARLDSKTQDVVPYYTRTQIDKEGALAGRGLELCYLADYMDAFLFHVQGGGFVELPDGRFLRLNYADKNGHPYSSIGRILVDEGIIPKDELNLPKVLDYLRSNPGEMERVCFMNESYVFYQADKEIYTQLRPDIFPHGVMGFPVTPQRSIATDKRHFPGGMLGYVQGGKPLVGEPAQILGAFVLDQDTGGAIVDAHLDFFAGAGKEAEALAGIMNDPSGSLYFLVLKPQQ